MNKIYYSQIDSRWKNHPYPSPALPNATIGSGGCGATCAAMVVSMLKQIIKPDEMGDIFVRDGIRVNGGTSNRAFDSYLTDKYGLKCQRNWKLDDAVACLKKGGIVVARCISENGTLFTTGGHFIVFVGYKDNVIEVFDPYLYNGKFNSNGRNGKATISGTSVFVTYDNMKAYGGYHELWCYEPTGVNTNKDESIPKNETVSYDRGTVGKTMKFSKNCNLWSNPDLTGTRYDYLKNTSVKVLENVSANVDKIYVPATGRTAYVDISVYTQAAPAKSSYVIKTVIARSGLNVRKEPRLGSDIVTAYAYGTKVKVYSTSNGWSEGTKGYMSAEYLR